MIDWLWMVPALPFAGFAGLFVSGGRLPARAVAAAGAGSVGLAALVAGAIAADYLAVMPPGGAVRQVLWQWMAVDGFTPSISLYLDRLSMVMMLVVTGVGFLIHLYSTEYMSGDEGYNRFFAYMNLFVGFMLVLVLAGDLLALFVGWEGVGLCSYLLIGHWYRDAANGLAARKAFFVTRVGDAAFLAGLLMLFTQLGTTDIAALLQGAVERWPIGSAFAVASAALLLGGAVGKSAQLPLQVWLPDAMAGPTPVSALIHAATMVTAGVYLIARMHPLYEIAPSVRLAVGVLGALTLLLAAVAALSQTDIKRILAYSTMSQIGYMFLALGAGAWSAAIFHFMTHAFFKALLFLSAGAVSLSLHHERDIFRMGGLRRERPLAFWAFLTGSAALAALPWVTAGYYSKGLILERAWEDGPVGPWLWAAGALGAFLTAVYIFRAVFIVFFGELRTRPRGTQGFRMGVPLVVLAVFSVGGGWISVPSLLGPLFGGPAPEMAGAASAARVLEIVASGLALLGVVLAYLLFLRRPAWFARWQALPRVVLLRRMSFSGLGFDGLYERLLVRPFLWLAQLNRGDIVDAAYNLLAAGTRLAHRGLSGTQTGVLRWYAAGVVFGAVLVLAVTAWSL
jgi:NADH-quinone oxidoreductase subunit L